MLINVDDSGLIAKMTAFKRQIPFAASRAINEIAKRVKDAETRAIASAFVNPTPFTQKAMLITQFATKDKLRAVVKVRDEASKGTPPARYLLAEVFGGARSQKRMERAMQVRYHGQTVWAVPATAQRNDYGNISQAEVQKLLSSLGVSPYAIAGQGKKRGRTLKERGIVYFIGRPGGGREPLGVWMRQARKLQPILLFTPPPTYTPRFQFFDVALKVANESRNVFSEELQKAMATAKNAR